jgi:hypothetical protein
MTPGTWYLWSKTSLSASDPATVCMQCKEQLYQSAVGRLRVPGRQTAFPVSMHLKERNVARIIPASETMHFLWKICTC